MLIAQFDKWIDRISSKDIYNFKLGIARSVIALSTLLTLLFNDTTLLFSQEKIADNKHAIYEAFNIANMNYFAILPFAHIEFLKLIAMIIVALVIIGWRPRYTCILHYWICLSFVHSSTIIEGGDQIIGNLTFLLIPIFIMDNRKSQWVPQNDKAKTITPIKNMIAVFSLAFIKLQMCFIYFNAAVGKISKSEWSDGTAVYYWSNDPTFGMPDWVRIVIGPILNNSLGVSAMTWGTLTLEILLFMAIIMGNRAKYFLLIVGLLFHLSIVLVHGLTSFFLSMAGGLLLYLWIDNPFTIFHWSENLYSESSHFISNYFKLQKMIAENSPSKKK